MKSPTATAVEEVAVQQRFRSWDGPLMSVRPLKTFGSVILPAVRVLG